MLWKILRIVEKNFLMKNCIFSSNYWCCCCYYYIIQLDKCGLSKNALIMMKKSSNQISLYFFLIFFANICLEFLHFFFKVSKCKSIRAFNIFIMFYVVCIFIFLFFINVGTFIFVNTNGNYLHNTKKIKVVFAFNFIESN